MAHVYHINIIISGIIYYTRKCSYQTACRAEENIECSDVCVISVRVSGNETIGRLEK